MYHSMTFGLTNGKNTWTDWHLIPTSRPTFNPPAVRTKYVEIPGVHGDLDLSVMLTGGIMYGNRTGSFEFLVAKYTTDWVTAYSTISEYLHGKHMEVVLEDDPLYYYEGRFSVNSWSSNKSFSTIVIDYNVRPFKRLISDPGSEGKL